MFQRVVQGNDHIRGDDGDPRSTLVLEDADPFNGDVQRTADEEPPPPELLAPIP